MIGLLLIGSGAREVAIARKIKESSSSTLLYCIASTTNPQIKNLSKLYFEQSPSEVSSVLELIKNLSIDLAIIGPENPLESGLVDALEKVGIPCVGPKRGVAKIETSKAFARNILDLCSPEMNPERKEFVTVDGVEDFLRHLNEEYVIKYNHDNSTDQIAYEVVWNKDEYKVKLLDLRVDKEGQE